MLSLLVSLDLEEIQDPPSLSYFLKYSEVLANLLSSVLVFRETRSKHALFVVFQSLELFTTALLATHQPHSPILVETVNHSTALPFQS